MYILLISPKKDKTLILKKIWCAEFTIKNGLNLILILSSKDEIDFKQQFNM